MKVLNINKRQVLDLVPVNRLKYDNLIEDNITRVLFYVYLKDHKRILLLVITVIQLLQN